MSDEEVYEEEHQHDIANRGQGVVRWREEKACTGPGLVHFGDPNQVRMGRQSAQLTDANFGSNSATLLHIQDQCLRYVVVVYI
jgi:hypothetical protein